MTEVSARDLMEIIGRLYVQLQFTQASERQLVQELERQRAAASEEIADEG